MCVVQRCSLLLFFILVRAQTACAQDEELPFLLGDRPTADSEWFSAYDGSWDPGWDRSWTNSNAPWQLSLVAGATFKGSDQQSQAPGSVSPYTDRRNYYAMAMLQVPLQELGVPRTKKRREAQSNREAQSEETEAHAPHVASSDQPSAEKSELAAPQPSRLDPAQPAPTEPSRTSKSQSEQEIALFPLGSSGANSEGVTSSGRAKQARTELMSLVKKLLQRTRDAEGHAASMAHLTSLRRRSRSSGLVPELRLRGVIGFDQDVSQKDTGGLYPGDSTTRGGRDSLVEARLTFRLDRLVYGDQEATLFQKRRDLEVDAQKRARNSVHTLVEWMTALRRSRDESLLFDEWLKAQGEEQQALLSLYLATDGWFQGEATLQALGLHQLLEELRSLEHGSSVGETSTAGAAYRSR